MIVVLFWAILLMTGVTFSVWLYSVTVGVETADDVGEIFRYLFSILIGYFLGASKQRPISPAS